METRKLIKKWIGYAILNLAVVALLGVLLRYKISFSFPIINQQHLLNSHFHFAFNGWAIQMIMTLLMAVIPDLSREQFKKFLFFLKTNFILSYGILISFIIQGYGEISIFFIFGTIVNFYVFGIRYWRILNQTQKKDKSNLFFKAAIIFNFISSIGIGFLIFLMRDAHALQKWHLMSVYFFLHFQYNGFFIFCCLGLFFKMLTKASIIIQHQKTLSWLFIVSLPPTYFLSVLWMKLPVYINISVIAFSLIQLLAWMWLIGKIWNQRNKIIRSFSPPIILMLIGSGIAMTIKFILQAVSTINPLRQYAFGFRPVVIGYLHLIFLGIVTLFLLAFSFEYNLIKINFISMKGMLILGIGIVLNELMLMIQGLTFMNYIVLPYSNEILFGIVCTIFIGITFIIISKKKQKQSKPFSS